MSHCRRLFWSPLCRERRLGWVSLWILSLLAPTTRAASHRDQGHRQLLERLAVEPLSFEANNDQSGKQVGFLVRGRGYSMSLGSYGAILSLFPRSGAGALSSPHGPRHVLSSPPPGFRAEHIHLRLVGARLRSTSLGEAKLPGTINYLLGDKPADWKTNIPTYARVRYSNAYPGIDLVYYGNGQGLEFDFNVAAGANPDRIAMQLGGVRGLAPANNGDLRIFLEEGSIVLRKPVVYQEKGGKRIPVAAGFQLRRNHAFGFTLGNYDRTRPLVIDPILTYSTYLGSATSSGANAVAVDAAGNAYVTGWAMADFPVTAGGYETKFTSKTGGGTVAFVTKFDPQGNVVYSTYLGGSVQDGGNSIAVDSAGDAYIAGYTASPDFPVTSGAYQTANKVVSQPDFRQFTTFVTKLDPTGSALVYSTFLGGSTTDSPQPQTEGQEQATGVALDSSGNAYVTGFTFSTDFPTTSGALQATNPGAATQQAAYFVSKLNAAGTALVYSTYLGGSYYDGPPAVAVDSSGDAYVAGSTMSTDYPTTPGAYKTENAASNGMAVVSKLNFTGTGLVYSTFLGGSYDTYANAIAVDTGGNAYVTGGNGSNDFPITPGALESEPGTVFVTKLNPAGSALVYSADMAPSAEGAGNAIAVDGSGNAFIAGDAGAETFPVTKGAFQTQPYSDVNGVDPSFVAEVNSEATALIYSTYLGGSGSNPDNVDFCDCVAGIALDPSGNAIVAGTAVSADFPTTLDAFEPGAFNLINEEETNFWAFVSKLNRSEMKALPLTATAVSANANPQLRETPAVFTAAVSSTSGSGVPTGSMEFSTEVGILCSSTLDSSGKATCSTTDLPQGDTDVRATYYGDANHAPSISDFTESIDGIPTTTAVAESQATAAYGTLVTVTATVSAAKGIPTGSVTFSVACSNGVNGYIGLDSNGVANCDTGTIPIGSYSVSANYLADANYARSTSNSLPLTIEPLGVTPTPTLSPGTGTYTQEVQATLSDASTAATIYYTTDGSIPPSASATIYVGPITIEQTESINAIAVAPGYTSSPVVSATYTLPPDFSMALSPTSLSLSAGQSATTTISIGSEFAFDGDVTFACSGLPAGTGCSFSPVSVTGDPDRLVTTTMTITAGTTAALRPDPLRWLPLTSFALVVGIGGFGKRRRLITMLPLAMGGMLAVFSVSACGGSGSSGGGNHTPVTSTVTVTGTSGSIQNTATLTVTLSQ